MKHLLVTVLLALGVSQNSRAVTSGTYTIGSGGNFPNLSTAFSDLNGSTITGPVIFNILPDLTYSGALWQGQITTINGSSATNTVTIQARDGAGTVAISAAGSSTVNYIIKLANVNYVTIKNLNLTNTNATNGRVIDIAGSSSNNVIQGCTLIGATGSATTDARAIVCLGTASAALTGSNNLVIGNTIQNGYTSVQVVGGSSTTTTDNNSIANNIITEPYVYGMYTSFAGNITISGNTITGTGTTLTHGFYFNYNQNGGTIVNNSITINTTSGTHYGMYNNYVNSNASPTSIVNNNNITVTASTGTAYSLYNNYSNRMSFTGNTFAAISTSGTVYQVFMAYYGIDITATGNTFTATAGSSGGLNNTTSYYFIYNPNTAAPNNIIVRDNVFNYNSAGAAIGTSSSGNYNMYYPINCKINKNRFNLNVTGSSTVMYGWGGYYWMYYGTNTTFDSNKITVNIPNGISTAYNLYYPYGIYYGTNNSFSNDTVTGNVASGGAFYALGYYLGMYGTGIKINNNVTTLTSTSATIYDAQYFTYSLINSEANNNKFTLSTTSGTVYAPYCLNYSNTNTHTDNNQYVINAATATAYMPYIVMYTGTGAVARNNTFTYNPTGSGSCSYCPYYLGYQGALTDTVENNTWNFTGNGGSYTTYNYYHGNLTRNNTWNIATTSGAVNFNFYYAYNGTFANNKINITTTTGTIYGLYDYPYGGAGYGLIATNNVWNLKSTSGTIYGYYNPSGYGAGRNTFIGNVISAKSSTGGIYLYYNPYGNYDEVKLFNNTFHGNTTSTTCQLFYQSGSSSTYPGRTYLYNNIFSRSNAATGNAVDVSDTAYFRSDYNMLYSPGAVTLRMGTPAVTATSLSSWRQGTGQDRNSVDYYPAYIDAANGDFRPDPASPASWAIQGRGVHLAGDTLDAVGNPRAKTRFDGVPDLGAYEFTPTSIPPDATAIPSTPAANSKQAFLFAGDTVCTIDWGNTVPSSITVKQYTGVQASVTPSITERMYFYTAVNTPVGVYEYLPNINYKDPWIGNVSAEKNARIAKSSNGGAWAGYNFGNGITDTLKNKMRPKDGFDSLSSIFTGVENARIGIRCIVPPSGLLHSGVTAYAATETWEPVFSPIGYQIIVDSIASPLDLTKKAFVSPQSPIVTYPISNLTERTTYYINVRTICGVKDTSTWAVDSFQTMVTCHAPTISSTSITDKQAVVYWDTVQTAVSYEYTIDESPNAPGFGTTKNANTVYANGLNPGTTYYAHVRSHCGTIYDISGWAVHQFTTLWPANVKDLNGKAGITAYPNPVQDVLNVNIFELPATGATISITDITGKTVYTEPVYSQKIKVNMSGFAAGMYLLKYTDINRTEVIKLNKE